MNSKQLIGSILDTTLRIVFIIAAIMLIYKYATSAYEFGYRVFSEEPISSEENARAISISFDESATVKDIANALEEKGLINDAKLFYVQELFSGHHGELKPGEYELSSAMTAEEMMAVMAADSSEEGVESEGVVPLDETADEPDIAPDTMAEEDGAAEDNAAVADEEMPAEDAVQE